MEDELGDPELAGRFAYELVSKRLGRGSADVDACASVASQINDRYAATFDHLKWQDVPIACKAGCNWCCYLRVEILPYEAIALFRYLRTSIPEELAQSISARILANAEQIAALTPEQHRLTNVQCAFLVDGCCSVYPVRPMLCAGHHSCDVSACEAGFNEPSVEVDSIPLVAVLAAIRGMMMIAAGDALREKKLKAQSLELHTTLAALLRNPALIGQWGSGRKLIKGGPELESPID